MKGENISDLTGLNCVLWLSEKLLHHLEKYKLNFLTSLQSAVLYGA